MNVIVLSSGGSTKSIGVHEATAPEAVPTKQLDDGGATVFVDATANNAHMLMLFWHKRATWQAARVSRAIQSLPDGASAARSIPKYNGQPAAAGRIVSSVVPLKGGTCSVHLYLWLTTTSRCVTRFLIC
jgi:hypothetical protein